MQIEIIGRVAQSTALLPYSPFKVPAGFPSPATDYMDQPISLDELLDIRAPHNYLVRVSGDSMTGAGIFDGDLLLVDKSRDAVLGEIVIAELNGEAICKRLGRVADMPVLYSENPKYSPRYVHEHDTLSIWGVVRFSVRSHPPA